MNTQKENNLSCVYYIILFFYLLFILVIILDSLAAIEDPDRHLGQYFRSEEFSYAFGSLKGYVMHGIFHIAWLIFGCILCMRTLIWKKSPIPIVLHLCFMIYIY